DPNNLGPILTYDESIAAISDLLNEAKTDLTGAAIVFALNSGFTDLSDGPGLIKLNRAIAARVDVYRKLWTVALTDLAASFLDINGDFTKGAYEIFSTGSGDVLNPAYFDQNAAGEVRLAHPSYVTDISAGDSRIGKATLRTATASNSGLSSNRDVWVYRSSTAPIPIIRNEELVLLYAEANFQLDQLPAGKTALDKVRATYGQTPTGALSKESFLTEMLRQRRFSLYYEGHRWIDMRRYNLLESLPKDRAGDDVWVNMPIPSTEQ
ncbi:MAG TPA: RagB/SusD family nutrient uptake outer membrane protein, partial [Chitinophagaceae bacterium]|nr:RagB/SusD family nutrient uptake outer membrane protein [Chitinophagaceae bacterium]